MSVSPYVWAAGAIFAGLGLAAWILRWEARHQLRQLRRRRGGFLVGGRQW